MSYRPDEPGYPGNPFPLEPFDASFVAAAADPASSRAGSGCTSCCSLLTLVTHDARRGSALCSRSWPSSTAEPVAVPLGAAPAGLLVQRHAAGDPRRPRDGPLPALPTIQRGCDACPTSFRCRLSSPDRHARRRDQDPRAVSEPDRAVRHRRRRSDRRVRRARPGSVLRHDALERRPGADRRQRPVPRRAAALPVAPCTRCSAPFADGYTVNMHPMVFAAWFGMLATALEPAAVRPARRRTHHVRDARPLVDADLDRHRRHRRRDDVRLDQLAADDDDDGGDARRSSARAIRA